jgi:hypothetical protein
MSMSDNGRPAPLQPGEQELAITGVLHRRLQAEDCLRPEDRESVAYRLAEIMVSARSLYTEVLPRLVEEDAAEGVTLFEELAAARMSLMHVKDLVEDFEEVFMQAMAHQREDDGNLERLSPPGEEE